MEPYWFVPSMEDAVQVAPAVQAQLEASAGDVWRHVSIIAIPALSAVIVFLVRHIMKDTEEDKREAKEREARLIELLKKKGEAS